MVVIVRMMMMMMMMMMIIARLQGLKNPSCPGRNFLLAWQDVIIDARKDAGEAVKIRAGLWGNGGEMVVNQHGTLVKLHTTRKRG